VELVYWLFGRQMEAAINSDHMLPRIRRDSLIRLRVIGGCYESWQERQKMT